MKKILVLLGRYFPKASPNSLCMQNIIDALPHEEYNVHVVAYDDMHQTTNNVQVTKFRRGIIHSLLYRSEGISSKKGKLLKKVLNAASKISQLAFLPIWPWTDPITTFREWNCVNRLMQDEHFDLILSVYMPLSSLIVGHKIKNKYPDVKFCACFLDSMTGGYVPRHMSEAYLEKSASRWEKRLLENADKVIFMESSRIHHEEIYRDSPIKEKIVYLDLPVLIPRGINQPCYANSETITLLYVGSLPMSIRSPEYLLKTFSLLADSALRFIFIGDSSCSILNEYAAKDARIKVFGRLPHDVVMEYEKRADVLVNIGNRNVNLTPSKVFEYLSYGKPILSTYCLDEDTSKSYLDRYSLACCVDQRKTIDESAMKINKFLSESIGKFVPFELVEMEYQSNTPKAYIKLIDKLVPAAQS